MTVRLRFLRSVALGDGTSSIPGHTREYEDERVARRFVAYGDAEYVPDEAVNPGVIQQGDPAVEHGDPEPAMGMTVREIKRRRR